MLTTSMKMKKCTAVFIILAALIPLTATVVDYSVETADLYAQILERDADPPTVLLNGTTTDLGEISINIDPVDEMPANGTVTMNFDGATDTNMNDIPPTGITVVITADGVTVTNHEVVIQ